jgi:hypothetical protein
MSIMRIRNIISTICIGIALSSCDFFEVKPQIITEDDFYKTNDEVKYALAGVYGVMSNEAFYGNYYSLMCSNIDDLCYYNRGTTSNYTNVYKHDATATEIYQAWTEIYKGIRNANAFMVSTPESLDQNGVLRNEARFLRAYYHFLLAQAWGDVPLRDKAIKVYNPSDLNCPASKQFDVLAWVAEEMEACVGLTPETLDNAPSRINKYTVRGILARVYLFMAGESVERGDSEYTKEECYKRAKEHTEAVITSNKFALNPDYAKVFINMISDRYNDPGYLESMWEVDFYGHRETASSWSNGRIGDLIGLQSSGSSGYTDFMCNFAYGQYNGSLKLWDLYWSSDRTEGEKETSNITDSRQLWNLPQYNYVGKKVNGVYTIEPSKGKVNYHESPTGAPAVRNCGKWRREVEYEGVMDSKRLYTGINFPILRYSDVLLMYAEASLELTGSVEATAYDCVKQVRDRAGIATEASYDPISFRILVRNERGRELCFEALRKYDLIRWGTFVESMKGYVNDSENERWTNASLKEIALKLGEAVQPKHVVLPVPSVELGVNRSLEQNPLW